MKQPFAAVTKRLQHVIVFALNLSFRIQRTDSRQLVGRSGMASNQSKRSGQVDAGNLGKRSPVVVGKARDREWIPRDHLQMEPCLQPGFVNATALPIRPPRINSRARW
jgi:hypothetical protein